MLVIPTGRRVGITFTQAWLSVVGRRVAARLGPPDPPPPTPEIIGDVTAGPRLRWGGLAPQLRSVCMAPLAFEQITPYVGADWGGLGAQVSRLAVLWGGMQPQRKQAALCWGDGQPLAVAALRSPWDTPPPVLNGTRAAWHGWGASLERSSTALWTVPPSQERATRLPWGGLLACTRTGRMPWSVPPKLQAPKRIPWGYGHGLEWVVRPPPSPTPPFVAKPVVGRQVGLHFRCHEYPHSGRRVPVRFGNLACFAARPLARAYVVLNEIEVVRLPDLLPIAVDAVALASGRDAWCWEAQVQLADPGQLAQVQPTVAGPRQLRITLNGYVWVIAVEAFDKGQVFGQTSVNLRGRSVTAQLAEPYAAPRAREEAAARTLHQLADAEVDGSAIALDFAGVDWLVTGGAWYYDGLTPMAALIRIAEAGGGVVQSHPSLPQVTIAPRYPVSPWDWTTTAPDVEIQDDIVTGTRLQLQSRPPFDAVIVAGEKVGVAARVVREGEAGQTYAPQQVDQLITHADGARERGRNVLSDRGGQASIEHDIPLFAAPLGSGQPGLVQPLQLVRRIAGEGTWHGLASGVRISATRQDKAIDIVQTVTIERRYTDAD
jgi:hypothetical protein